MTGPTTVVEDGLEPLAEAFTAIVADGTPGALVVRHRGRVVLRLGAGTDAVGEPFAPDVPVLLYSAVKPFTALCALLAVADGALDLDATVAATWPSFAAHGKDRVSVRQALAHAAAVPGWRRPRTVAAFGDRAAAAEELAASQPWWPPGEPGEHAVSYGHLVDGILRHATGRDVVHWWRVARTVTGVDVALVAADAPAPPARLEDVDGAWGRACRDAPGRMGALLANPAGLTDAAVMDGPAGRALVAPAVTGYASAGALAALWDWWTGPAAARRLGPGLRDASLETQVEGLDHVLGGRVRWGLGPQVDADFVGMGGVGGCVGGHDPRSGLSLAFTTPRLGSLDRLDPLEDALAALA